MGFAKENNNNILLNKLEVKGDKFSVREIVPSRGTGSGPDVLSMTEAGVSWTSVVGGESVTVSADASHNIVIDCSINPFRGTEMYFRGGRVGIGRYPLYEYKVDVGVPINTRTTALHIGDGRFGFSLGNATNEGFLPQIIGLGSRDSGIATIMSLGFWF